MPDRLFRYRTQALFQNRISPCEKQDLLVRCYHARIDPAQAAVLLEMRRQEVENWYLRLALSIAQTELQRVSESQPLHR
jgi:hypothetical protein